MQLLEHKLSLSGPMYNYNTIEIDIGEDRDLDQN